VFDTVSAPRAGSLAASRKNTMERVHAGLVRDNKERLVARAESLNKNLVHARGDLGQQERERGS
jgi:hypothetical protein